MISFYLLMISLILSTTTSLNESCFKNICFNISPVKANYSIASQECKKLNLNLAFISDKNAQSFLKKYINSSADNFYIGLKYIPKQRFIWDCNSDEIPNLEWSLDIKLDFNELCVFITANGMNMAPCNVSRRFICSNASHTTPEIITEIGDCPVGFFRFLNKCYQMNLNCDDETMTWKESQNKCKSLSQGNGHLAVVNSMIEQEFVTALMTKSPLATWTGLTYFSVNKVFTIWINQNKKMPLYHINFKKNEPNDASKDEKCLMVYHRLSDIGRINDENCDKYLNYLCETQLIKRKVDKVNTNETHPLFNQSECKSGFFQFNDTCYSIDVTPRSYIMANKTCNGNLLHVHGFIDLAFLRSLMAFKNVSNVWLSISDKVSQVTDGANWLLQETNNSSILDSQSCYTISSKVKGLHKKNCSDSLEQSICYYYLDSHEQSTEGLKCPINWKKVGSKCYKVQLDQYDFGRSVEQCNKYNGQLATITNMKELQAITTLLTLDSWIGLNGKSFLRNEWIYGSQLKYCQFRHTTNIRQKINKNPKDSCFVLRHDKSEWVVRSCNQTNVFTCEQPAKNNYCPKILPINIDGDCYGEFLINKTWDEAEKHCQTVNNRTHLVSFHIWEQENILFQKVTKSELYWIGLRIYNSIKRWVDNSTLNYQRHTLVDVIHPHDFTSCFSTKNYSKPEYIWWIRSHCQIRRPFLCKYSKHGLVKAPIHQDIIEKHYSCPHEFVKHEMSCFKYFNESSSWTHASMKCNNLFKFPNSMATLASFDTIYELESVLSSLRNNVSSPVWIGLMKKKPLDQYLWVNEKPFNILKSVEEVELQEGPVAMHISYNPFRNGLWQLFKDTNTFPFLCRVDPLKPMSKWSEEIVEPYNEIKDHNCHSLQQVIYNGHCYFYNKDKLKFQEADKTCKNIGSSLLIVNDTFEEYFIRSLLAKYNQNNKLIWMGINVVAPNIMQNWSTTENIPVFYTHWLELNNFNDSYKYPDDDPKEKIPGCYVLSYDNNLQVDNGMLSTSCHNTLPSICKKTVQYFHENSVAERCAKSFNNTEYLLDVKYTRNNKSCVRWDLVTQINPYLYHLNLKLLSSFPFNKDGYLSYSLDRCSEFHNDSRMHGYSCFILKDNKYILEECSMIPCHPTDDLKHESNHPFLILTSIIIIIFALGFFIYIYRVNLLSNYGVRECLARVLGRYQPDWLRYPTNRSQPPTVSGTGFVNPVYTPLESRY